ncbi:MAG TPA: radical SAM protein [Clostridiales bacterium]|nr:radical SAM protein [Clostridiales bacterium]HQP69896.1 radical SAM protein [Clostridiales bacterium]
MNKNIIDGYKKSMFILKLKLIVALHFMIHYRSKNLREYFLLLKRLNYFIGKLEHNKFVRQGKYTKIELYVPKFPSDAFFTSCNKFAVFGEKLPCTTVLLSVTSACRYNCAHCYQRLDKGKDIDLEKLIPIAKYLQDQGVAFFNIEGGEPFLVFDRLLALCKAVDKRSEIWVNSTGDGMTAERLAELKKTQLAAVMFSLHSHDPEKINAFMGYDKAWENLENGVKLCHEAGITVTFNTCLMKEDSSNGNFEKLMDKAKYLGGSLIQLIKPKPSGAWLESGTDVYSEEDFVLVKNKVNMYNNNKKYIEYPAIAAQIIEEDPGMFGCTSGGTDRFYINAKGDVQPCEFLNISFGNINEEKFEKIYSRMRKVYDIPGTCILCEELSQELRNICRENDLKTLPLDKELSKRFYDKIKNCTPTEMYRKVEKEMI